MVAAFALVFGPVAATADTLSTITPLANAPTELIMRGTESGQGVRGYIAPVGDTAFNPVNGYPSAKPAGFSDLDEGFAGIIIARPPDNSVTVRTYCIDIRTPTRNGFGYTLGEWNAAQVPLVGYVARILSTYYPNSSLPSAAPNDNARAAAVQAAIWFFTDKYVLRSTDAVYPYTRAIVEEVLAAGPITTPPPPSLQILPPPDQTAVIGSTVGPFTVQTTAPATLSVSGGQMFLNAAGTVPVTNPVNNGAQIWLKSASPGAVTLSANARTTVPSGNVYLYDGKTAGVSAAQKLILAQTTELQTTTTATALFSDTGVLVVEKAVDGNGAGLQGDIVIAVQCGGTQLDNFTIPAGALAGVHQARYGPLPTPTTCTLTELSTGENSAVAVSASPGVTVQLPQNTTPGDEAVGRLTDTATRKPGSLVVTKTITGAGNALRDPIVIDVSCTDGTTARFTIPPGQQPAASYTVPNIQAGAVCTTTESQSGGNSRVSSESVVDPADPVTIPPGGPASVAVSNALTLQPGALAVTKTIAGAGAALRGDIVIDVSCDNGTTASFPIPAGQAPEPSYVVDGLPDGTVCTVSESQTGGNSQVSADVTITPGEVATIGAGATSTVAITDTYITNPGSLLVTKTIGGNGAALRGDVVLDVSCDNGTIASFTVPAGEDPAPAGYLVAGLPAGTVCSVTESADGSNGSVAATVSIGADATIPPGGQAAIAVDDTYQIRPTGVTLSKAVAGPGATLRGEISLRITCTDGTDETLILPTGVSAGSIDLGELPGDARCTVEELQDGSNSQVAVLVEGLVSELQLTPGGAVDLTVTNTFARNPGNLIVSKTIGGVGAELRGDVAIDIVCTSDPQVDPVDTLLRETWTIPAGTEPQWRSYSLPAQAACTVTETADGSNGQVAATRSYIVDDVATAEPATTTVPAGGTTVVAVGNEYQLRAGSLSVTKTITGAAAGQQGDIVLDVLCRTPEGTVKPSEVTATFTIPAGATTVAPFVLADVPAGLACTVTESRDGATSTVRVTSELPGPAEVPPGGEVSATVTNTYASAPAPAPGPDTGGNLPDTGAGSPAHLAWVGLLLLMVGAALRRMARQA